MIVSTHVIRILFKVILRPKTCKKSNLLKIFFRTVNARGEQKAVS
jgi:hypothetical protein